MLKWFSIKNCDRVLTCSKLLESRMTRKIEKVSLNKKDSLQAILIPQAKPIMSPLTKGMIVAWLSPTNA